MTSVTRDPARWPLPTDDAHPGTGVAVLVNANAKRGGRRVAVQIARAMPGASVRLTKSAQEIDAWLRMLHTPRAVLAAGGDGTAVALVNALARVTPAREPLPVMGVLPLGTGNGWAHALGAPKLHRCLRMIADEPGALPTRRCGLLEVDGTLAHFAGSGWDAMILHDYKRQLEQSKGPAYTVSKSVWGYLSATLTRTVPKVVATGNPRLILENLGQEVFGIDADGTPRQIEGLGPGTVLYDGPFGVASVGTCPEFGYRFRAFPFAERMPGFINARVYDQGPVRAVGSIPMLWKGQHPMRGMHDWFVTHARMTFSRDVALQIGGDASGMRRTVEYKVSERTVQMIDWRRLLCLQ